MAIREHFFKPGGDERTGDYSGQGMKLQTVFYPVFKHTAAGRFRNKTVAVPPVGKGTGDLYVGEVCYTAWHSLFPQVPKPARIRSLQKYERVAV